MYVVTQTDLKGDLKDFPVAVVQMMIMRQVEQGNPADVEIFQRDATEGRLAGGFIWRETEEGYDFWDQVINWNDWRVFYDRYPDMAEAIGYREAKPLKASRKMHLTKAQKWCLERIRFATGSLHEKLYAVLCGNIRNASYFDFPTLPSEIDEALKVFCIEGYSLESLDGKISEVSNRIGDTLNSLYYMDKAWRGDSGDTYIRIWDKGSASVRGAINWAKKHYTLLGKMKYVQFRNEREADIRLRIVGKTKNIPLRFVYDKELGVYRSTYENRCILGDILLDIE